VDFLIIILTSSDYFKCVISTWQTDILVGRVRPGGISRDWLEHREEELLSTLTTSQPGGGLYPSISEHPSQ